MLATSSASAGSRFNGSGAPWVRVDGVALTDTAAELVAGSSTFLPLAPSLMTAKGDRTVTGAAIATGAPGPGAVGTAETCTNWTSSSSSGTARIGSPAFLGPGQFFNQNTMACDFDGLHLYCLQQ